MARKPDARFTVSAEDKTAAALRSAQANLDDFGRTAKTAAGLFGGIFTVAAAGQALQFVDRFNQLSARIRTATRDTGDFLKVQEGLLASTIRTGAELETTVDLFQGLARVRDDIGATNDQMLVLTEVVQQLGVIGGTSGEAMANGLRQFTQAMAAGTFRAEEFNSLVENTPELVRRIAEGLGVTQGALREMLLDGRLFSTDVVNALLKQAPQIAAEFEEIPGNLDRAFSSLTTSIGAAASELDRSVGLTQSLARGIQDAAEGFDVWRRNIRAVSISEEIGQLSAQLEGQRPLSFSERLLDMLGLRDTPEASGILPGAEAAIRKRIDELRVELDAILGRTGPDRDNPGTVGGNRPAPVAEVPKSVTDAAARHFEQQIEAEARFLTQQRELRIRGAQELETALREEETRLRTEALAEALGFETVAAEERANLEAELFAARMERRAAEMDEELALELGYKSARDMALEEAEIAHQERLLEARTRGFGQYQKVAQNVLSWDKKTAAERTSFVLDQAAALTAGLAQQSKAAFYINKAAAIASAIVNTAQGVTAALALGPAGIPLANVIKVLGAAQVATIAATAFTGGSGTSAVGIGSSGGVPSMAANEMFTPPTVSPDERNNATIRLEIAADDSELARVLMKNVRVIADEEDDLLASGSSRQAVEFIR